MPARKAAAPVQDASFSEDDLMATAPKPAIAAKTKTGTKRKAPASKTASRQALKDRTNTAAVVDPVEEDRPVKKSKIEVQIAPAKIAKSIVSAKSVKPKQTQPVINEQSEIVAENEPVAPLPARTSSYVRAGSARPQMNAAPPGSGRAGSAQPSYVRERSASATGFDRLGDTEMRRQLAAKSRELESLRLRYQALEDLVQDGGQCNFDKLKAEADIKTKRADDLVASLRKEIAGLKKYNSEVAVGMESNSKLQEELSRQSDELSRKSQEHERQIIKLGIELEETEAENEALKIKLAAARQQSSGPVSKTPGSRAPANATNGAYQELKMKENLYTDLTGLIIRSAKRKDGEDEYDCIQTGRNGTLHFRLAVANDTANPKTPSAYEDAEFAYEPKLDEKRDQALLDILPDYLAEDICFPRNHAVKFYSKVVESMTKRIVVEDEDH